ncbi:MAG: hypothetical protein ROZ09_16245 [Thiobacillus sp.]|uniref:hypothetical protein n=1 Tax=Thiobacillus sp. TaxID=924 RepID=UPI0028938ED8|nr:hypothetical protein [Thiobacillus sp.]MDT3708371.1 hypothetical protein [Thiobacillus sp.]
MNRVALAACLLSAALVARAAQPIQRRDGSNSLRSSSVKDLAKDKNKRAIRFGVVNVASMVFLPI